MSRANSVNRGTEEVDQSRRLEIGLVNVDSHSSGTGLGWWEVITIICFVFDITVHDLGGRQVLHSP